MIYWKQIHEPIWIMYLSLSNTKMSASLNFLYCTITSRVLSRDNATWEDGYFIKGLPPTPTPSTTVSSKQCTTWFPDWPVGNSFRLFLETSSLFKWHLNDVKMLGHMWCFPEHKIVKSVNFWGILPCFFAVQTKECTDWVLKKHVRVLVFNTKKCFISAYCER